MYLVFNDLDAYFEEYHESKYMVFVLTDKNREGLEDYKELWYKIKDKIETIRGIEPIKYEKDFTKIKFESNDDLPLGEILNNHKYYPQFI